MRRRSGGWRRENNHHQFSTKKRPRVVGRFVTGDAAVFKTEGKSGKNTERGHCSTVKELKGGCMTYARARSVATAVLAVSGVIAVHFLELHKFVPRIPNLYFCSLLPRILIKTKCLRPDFRTSTFGKSHSWPQLRFGSSKSCHYIEFLLSIASADLLSSCCTTYLRLSMRQWWRWWRLSFIIYCALLPSVISCFRLLPKTTAEVVW